MLAQGPSVKRKSQQGISLIESMIALLVVSIGLLGIAALQITAMNQNASSLKPQPGGLDSL